MIFVKCHSDLLEKWAWFHDGLCLVVGESPLTADIRLETESDYGSDEESQLFLQSSYKPRQALVAAISDWMEEIHSHNDVSKTGREGCPESLPLPMGLQVTAAPTPGVNTCMVPTMTTNTPSQPIPIPSAGGPSGAVVDNLNELVRSEIVNDSYLAQPTSHSEVASSSVGVTPGGSGLVDSGTDTDEESVNQNAEPMDCAVTPGSTPVSVSIPPATPVGATSTALLSHSAAEDCASECGSKSVLSSSVCDSNMQVDSAIIPSCSSQPAPVRNSLSPTKQLETPVSERCLLTQEDIALLVDLFYMPFEHGSTGVKLLKEFAWLKNHCHALSMASPTSSSDNSNNSDPDGVPEASCVEWRERAQKFRELVATIGKLMERLCNSPNQGLVYDMYPYVWDMWSTASLLGSFIEWLGTLFVSCVTCTPVRFGWWGSPMQIS